MTKRGGARPGAGRPSIDPGAKRVKVSASLRHSTWQAVMHCVEQRGGSVSEAIDAMLSHAAAQAPFARSLERRLPAQAQAPIPATATHHPEESAS